MDQWGERQAEAQRRKEEKQLARQTKLQHEGILPVKVRDREGGGGREERERVQLHAVHKTKNNPLTTPITHAVLTFASGA